MKEASYINTCRSKLHDISLLLTELKVKTTQDVEEVVDEERRFYEENVVFREKLVPATIIGDGETVKRGLARTIHELRRIKAPDAHHGIHVMISDVVSVLDGLLEDRLREHGIPVDPGHDETSTPRIPPGFHLADHLAGVRIYVEKMHMLMGRPGVEATQVRDPEKMDQIMAACLLCKLQLLQDILAHLKGFYRGLSGDPLVEGLSHTYRLQWKAYHKENKRIATAWIRQCIQFADCIEPSGSAGRISASIRHLQDAFSSAMAFRTSVDQGPDDHLNDGAPPPPGELELAKRALLDALASARNMLESGNVPDPLAERLMECSDLVEQSGMEKPFKESFRPTLQEMGVGLTSECYISVICLAGRICEGCLKQVMILCGHDDSEMDRQGIHALWNRMQRVHKKGLPAEDLQIDTWFIEYLARFRNAQVHDRSANGMPAGPSRENAETCVTICIDLIKRVTALTNRKDPAAKYREHGT